MTSLFNTLNTTQKRLLILLQNSLWGKGVDANLFEGVSQGEWKEIMELAAVQGVFGLVYDGMNGLTDAHRPPKDLHIQWALGVKQIEIRHHHQLKALQSLAEIYRKSDIQCLLIKGIGIGQLYPIPEHRECGDIDIYLFGDYARGNLLMEEKGIKVEYQGEVHSKFYFEQVPVENHLSFLQIESYKANRELELILHQALLQVPPELSKEFGVCIPSLSFNLLYLLKHTVRHFIVSGIVLRQLCDWALLLHQCRDNDNYPAFYETIKRFDLQRYADVYSYIAAECLGLPESQHFAVIQDHSFAQKVFSDIMNQKRIYSFPSNVSLIQILKRKLKGAVFFSQSRWKYDAINKKMFFMELILRLRNTSQIFKSTKPVN